MSARVVFAMPGSETLADAIAAANGCGRGGLETRCFPDGETYVRLLSDVRGADVDLVANLANPDRRMMRLILVAGALREWGAARIRLIAPYHPYLRQDAHFREGEALSATHFARVISAWFDGLVTLDPHLHRIKALAEIYDIPTKVAHAASLIGAWIAANVERPVLIGPDAESVQWVRDAAAAAKADHIVLTKVRRGDRSVDVHWPQDFRADGRTPVIVDDVASSGETLLAVAQVLSQRRFPKPICVVVHAVFSGDAYDRLASGYAQIVSTDAILHPTNAISIADLLT